MLVSYRFYIISMEVSPITPSQALLRNRLRILEKCFFKTRAKIENNKYIPFEVFYFSHNRLIYKDNL